MYNWEHTPGRLWQEQASSSISSIGLEDICGSKIWRITIWRCPALGEYNDSKQAGLPSSSKVNTDPWWLEGGRLSSKWQPQLSRNDPWVFGEGRRAREGEGHTQAEATQVCLLAGKRKPWRRLDPSHPLLWTRWLPQAVLPGLGKRQEHCWRTAWSQARLERGGEAFRPHICIYPYSDSCHWGQTNEADGEKRLSPSFLLRTTGCAYGMCK